MYYRDSFDEENFDPKLDDRDEDDWFDDDFDNHFYDEDDIQEWARYTKFDG